MARQDGFALHRILPRACAFLPLSRSQGDPSIAEVDNNFAEINQKRRRETCVAICKPTFASNVKAMVQIMEPIDSIIAEISFRSTLQTKLKLCLSLEKQAPLKKQLLRSKC